MCIGLLLWLLMLLRPRKSTCTCTRFPYATLFRSRCGRSRGGGRAAGEGERGRGSDEMAAGKRLNHPATISDQPLMSMVSDVNWSLVRSEEHTSELKSLMRNSYAVFCLKKKQKLQKYTHTQTQYQNAETH